MTVTPSQDTSQASAPLCPERAAKLWSIYMVRDASNRLYTGISTDVGRRFAEHQAGKGARALRGRGPLTLVWQQEIGEHALALRLEYQLKQWRKSRKEALLHETPSPDWEQLLTGLKLQE